MVDLSSLAMPEKGERIDSGLGLVHERTVEFGDTIIVLHNVGTMALISEQRNPAPVLMGVVIGVFGLMAWTFSTLWLIILLGVAAMLIYWGLNRKLDVFLLIGTADGRSLRLVSKDRKFLADVRTFLRRKIDENSLQTATINITARDISGGVAVGASAQASGEGGAVHNRTLA